MSIVALVLSGVLSSGAPSLEVIEFDQPGRTLVLDKLPLVERTSNDVQYRGTRVFRGLTLDKLIDAAKPGFGSDLVVLRFKNGMVVPFPFRKLALVKQLDAFVALELKVDRAWTSSSPSIGKAGAEERDRRPIVFGANKLVVANGWHPSLPEGASPDASPWLYVDSLSSMEFTTSDVWNAQFLAKSDDPQVKQGEKLFFGRCVFCHGVKKAGATWGWDFVVPVPLFQHRGPKSLWLHVKSRQADAPETGLMMPAFRDVTEADAAALWKWMEAIAR